MAFHGRQNFRDKDKHDKCLGDRNAGGRVDGDWICDDERCGNKNYARRTECNRCGKPRPHSSYKVKNTNEIGNVMAQRSRGLFSAEDWQCKSCGNVNWARRHNCNVCNSPKYQKEESRTGYGGGFMEREENVQYKEREESDDEYDQYGRLKKGRKKGSSHSKKEFKDEDNIYRNESARDEAINKRLTANDSKGNDGKSNMSKYKLKGDKFDDDSKDKNDDHDGDYYDDHKKNDKDDDDDHDDDDDDDDDDDENDVDISKYTLDVSDDEVATTRGSMKREHSPAAEDELKNQRLRSK